MTACPPDLLHRGSIKGGEGGGGGGGGETSDCTGEGVTYQVTQNGFWTVREEDEKVALASVRPLFSDSSHIWTEIIRCDYEIIINS